MTVDNLLQMYVKKIRAGKITLNEVPEKWREQVANMLKRVDN